MLGWIAVVLGGAFGVLVLCVAWNLLRKQPTNVRVHGPGFHAELEWDSTAREPLNDLEEKP